MNRNLIILAWSGALGLLMLGGCATCCGEPTIDLAKVKITVKQPEDVLVKVGGKATFSTGARSAFQRLRSSRNCGSAFHEDRDLP